MGRRTGPTRITVSPATCRSQASTSATSCRTSRPDSSTPALLQLMEDGRLDDVPRLKDPIRDVWHNVELRNPEQWKVELEDGRIVSPIDVQRYYLEKIETTVQDDWERRAMRTFEEVLDGLEN